MFQFLNSIACSHLTAAQIFARENRCFSKTFGLLGQIHDFANPIAKRARSGQGILDLSIVEQLLRFHINRDHLTRPKCAFFNYACLINRHHARLRTRNQHPIARYHIAHWTQTVPVKTRTNPTTISHC